MAVICNVPNREYISALRQCAKEHENENLFTGQIDTTALCNDTAKLLENDVIERSKVNKAIEEMNGYARFHRDKIHNDVERGKYLAYEKSLEILKRNIGE